MTHVLEKLPEAVRKLYRLRILRDIDIHLAETLNRRFCAGNAGDPALLACCLASRVVAEGHVCLDLSTLSSEWLVSLAPAEDLTSAALPDEVRELYDRLCGTDVSELASGNCELIGNPETECPLVVHGARVYLRRYWNYESRIVARLARMSTIQEEPAQTTAMQEYLDGLQLEDAQRKAIETAMQRRLTIVSGGPGTGKTYIAARILELLLKTTTSTGRIPVVRMAAPTGKAATRLDQSVRDALDGVGESVNGLNFEPACTIDRLLGFKPGSPYFRHDHENPLSANVILVDEASMIDLPKMAKLLDGMPENCRIVLFGDMHQLASVDPGSVMADLCSSKRLSECVCELTVSRRFPEGSPVHRLGSAINSACTGQDADVAWKILDLPVPEERPGNGIKRHDVPEFLSDRAGKASPELSHAVINGYRDFMLTEEPGSAFKALARFRILCALRRGPFGVETMNGLVEAILSGRAIPRDRLPTDLPDWPRLRPSGEFYDHRVVMVTRNDYSTELFNGDVGIIMPDDEEPERLVAWFEGGKNKHGLRKVSCPMLPDHETAFAMTIHKSQGSEFEHLLVMLPRQDGPVLTKELLYTAITRSRGGVDLWCNEDVFKKCVTRATCRDSGLGEALG